MADIRSIISSFLLIIQTNNAILSRIEFMVVLNSILLLILFILDTYRRRSRSKLVKYILLVVDAASISMVFHTIGMMQSAPLRNNLFEVWTTLVVALRFSTNYVTVYGLQDGGQFQWNAEFATAVGSITWAAKLNGTSDSGFKIPVWFLWALQPLRLGYMLTAYYMACKSYRQGNNSFLIADYMEKENEQKDPEASSKKDDSSNNPECIPNDTNPDDDCGVGPKSDSSISNQWGNPAYTVEEAEPETIHMVITDPEPRTYSQSVNPAYTVEEAEPETIHMVITDPEPRTNSQTVNPAYPVEDAEPETIHMVITDPEPRTNSQSVNPAYTVEDAEPETTHMVITDPKPRTNSQSVTEIEEVSQKTDYQEPSNYNPNAKPPVSIQEADVRTNLEVPSGSEAYDPSSMRGYHYLVQGETWQVVEASMFEDKLQMMITRKEKLITLEKIWQCKGKLLGEWGDKDGQLKDLCLSYALYRLLRCRFDSIPLPDNSIAKTRTLLVDGILSRTKNRESPKKEEELQEGNREENGGTEERSVNEKQQNLLIGSGCCLTRVVFKNFSKAMRFIPLFQKKQQQDCSNAEKSEDEVKEEIADRVFEITGTELSFLNDYMYSRFPLIFWRAGGLIVSIFFYISIVAITCWIATKVHVYTPSEDDFTHVIHGYNIDVFITGGMLFFVLFKETWEILIYLFSDWTKVVLVSMYVECACMRNSLMENLIWLLCKCSMVGRWHGKIDQYHFIEAYNYKPPVCNLAHYLSLGSLPKATNGVETKSQIVLKKEVKKAIVNSISSLLKEQPKKGRLLGRIPFILNRNKLSEEISQMCELHELPTCSHIILVWHIATSLCEIELCRQYNIYLQDSDLPSLWSSLNCCSSQPFLVKIERLGKDQSKNFMVANSLSRYCAHLIIKQPDLLPDKNFIADEVFHHTVHEARNTLEGCDTLQSIYKRLMKEGGKEIESKNEKTIMRLSARLGKLLVETLDEDARWKALAGVWADLLVCLAPNSNVTAHRKSLATGGEFITHVWILLFHAGILKNSLIDQGEDNDIENPE